MAATAKKRKILAPPSLACTPSDPPKDVKHTEDAIEHRRRWVQQAMIRGISAGTIAKQLGVHRNTIVSDIREIRKENAKKVEEADILEEVGDAAQFFDQVCKDAMFEVADNSHPMAKVSFMSIAMKAKADKLKLLTQVGVIPAVPRREPSAANVLFGDDVDLDQMQAGELMQLKAQILAELDSIEVEEESEGEVIDVEATVKDVQTIAEDE